MDEFLKELVPKAVKTVFEDTHAVQQQYKFKLPVPWGEWQRRMMHDDIKLMIFALGTKAGKTLGGTVRVASKSYASEASQNDLYRVIAPTYPLSKLTYAYLNRILPPTLPDNGDLTREQYRKAQEVYQNFRPERSEHKQKMWWQHNGASIEFTHAQDPETTIEGHRTRGNLIDEMAKCKPRTYPSVLSTTSQTGGWICGYGTPRGKNHYYDLYKLCEEHMRWAVANGKPLEMFCATVPTWTSPFVKPEVIERAKRTMPERIFRQLYGAEFLDDGSVFIGFAQCYITERIVIEEKIQTWIAPDAKKAGVVIGVDWAKHVDFCVMVAMRIDETDKNPRVVGFSRFQDLSYKVMVKMLVEFSKMFNDVSLVKHDATGIGDVINEMVQSTGLPVEAFKFSNQSKSNLVDEISIAFQFEKIGIPNWDILASELSDYECTSTSTGLPKYGASPGEHDDAVTALMLAWSAARDFVYSNLEVSAASERTPIQSYFDDLANDEDGIFDLLI